MPTHNRPRTVAFALTAAALVLGACTGSSDEPTSSETTAPPTASADTTVTPSPDATSEATEATSSPTPTAAAPDSTAQTQSEDSGLQSSVGTNTSDIQSSVEVRVREIISDFEGEVTTQGTELTIPGEVLFDTDEDTLRRAGRTDLDKVVEVLDFYGGAPVEIIGHTDSRSSDDYNQDLSERRADSVAGYLVDAGIARNRMTVEGRGESEPVATNDTAAGRQRNRRVVITVVGVEPPDAG